MLIGLGLTAGVTYAASILSVPQGGTGVATFPVGSIVVSNPTRATGTLKTVLGVDGKYLRASSTAPNLFDFVTVTASGGSGATTTLNGAPGPTFLLNTGISGTDFNIATSGATVTFNLPYADATHDGKLASTTWTTFNNKQATIGVTAPITLTGVTVGLQSNLGSQNLWTSGFLNASSTLTTSASTTNLGILGVTSCNILNTTGAGTVGCNNSTYLTSVNLATNVSGVLPVGNGGTGQSILTANNILYGNGTSPVATSSGLTFTGGNTLNVTGTATVSNILMLGLTSFASPFTVGQTWLAASSSFAGFVEANLINRSTATTASSDYVLTADNGTASTYYSEHFQNSSTYTKTSAISGGPGDAGLFSSDASLVLGTASSTNANANLYLVSQNTNIATGTAVGFTFKNATTSALAVTSLSSALPVRSLSTGVLFNGAIVLSGTDVSGILPIANGGTNSSTLASTLVGFTANDTNIQGSIANNTLTFAWAGTLSVARGGLASSTLGTTVVGFTANDTNVTGSIANNTLTLGWAGNLAYARGGSATTTSFTQGSVLFAGSASYAENNANFFWDNTNARLGIGSSTPIAPFTIQGATANGNGVENIFNTTAFQRETLVMRRKSGTTGGLSFILDDALATSGKKWEFFTTDVGNTEGPGKFLIYNSTNSLYGMSIDGSGRVGIGNIATSTATLTLQGTGGQAGNLLTVASSTAGALFSILNSGDISVTALATSTTALVVKNPSTQVVLNLDMTATIPQINIGTTTTMNLANLYVVGGSASTTAPLLKVATSSGLTLFLISPNGAIGSSSTPPVLSSCGTTPSINAAGDNFGGTVTVGSGAVTGCVVTFGIPFANTPTAVVTSQTATSTFGYSISTTALTITDVNISGKKFDYILKGNPN